mmetsp:Transcript_12040/g.28252  ORF Transcript_12040/g.28252 Transcript_12040/m.28252 type:complete len:171 (+) Transcript_12040:153-665(+)
MSWSWAVVSRTTLLASGGLAGAFAATVQRSRERQRMIEAGEYWELNGQFYQVLGHGWDHFRRDFCVVYRPLYNCQAKSSGFEAHLLATSHFERFESKFRRVDYATLGTAAKGLALPGPFWQDDSWGFATRTAPVIGSDEAKAAQAAFAVTASAVRTPTSSGYGTRSHQEY